MTFEQFLNKVRDIIGNKYLCGYQHSKYGCVQHDKSNYFLRDHEEPYEPVLSIRWRTGGMDGGSCWGGKPNTPISGELEPEFEELDAVLEELVPNLSYLDYKKLTPLVKVESDIYEPEYYGNYSQYTMKTMELRALYNFLTSMEILRE